MTLQEKHAIQAVRNVLFDTFLTVTHYKAPVAANMILSTYKHLCEKIDEYEDRERKREYDRERNATKKAREKERTG
ncbi:hypothetical protein LCGC14_2423140 [marine sediment metagenome]|uniref:Uncharacterized protein n=1 Tax=marine sediment metagenome TaxID=412755 RepID=A0A0F9EIA6_9ZZZZ